MTQPSPLETTDGLLQKIRDRFHHVDSCPITGERVFFENAGGALTLRSVVETTSHLAAIPDNQGRDNPASAHLMDRIARARDDIRLFFNVRGGEAFVGESGTELLFRVISAACLSGTRPGRVIGSTLEHPASSSAAQKWAETAGLTYVGVAHDSQAGDVTVGHYAPHLGDDIRVATIVHTSPVTGIGVDIAAISRAIRAQSPDCLIIVDGIQHAAHGAIDLSEADVDAYVISPYKVFSRHGYGVAWVSDRLAALPHNSLIGGPARGWDLGTRDTSAYATFSDVVGYLEWLGSALAPDIPEENRRARLEAAGRAIVQHEHSLTHAMLHGTGNLAGLLQINGIEVIGTPDHPAREGLVSFTLNGHEAPEIVAALAARGIRTHSRKADHYSGNVLQPLGLNTCVRVSLAHYNSREEVALFLTAIRDIADG